MPLLCRRWINISKRQRERSIEIMKEIGRKYGLQLSEQKS